MKCPVPTLSLKGKTKNIPPYMQEKFLGELIFARRHAGPVLALVQIQENIFEGSFSAY